MNIANITICVDTHSHIFPHKKLRGEQQPSESCLVAAPRATVTTVICGFPSHPLASTPPCFVCPVKGEESKSADRTRAQACGRRERAVTKLIRCLLVVCEEKQQGEEAKKSKDVYGRV